MSYARKQEQSIFHINHILGCLRNEASRAKEVVLALCSAPVRPPQALTELCSALGPNTGAQTCRSGDTGAHRDAQGLQHLCCRDRMTARVAAEGSGEKLSWPSNT